MTTRILTPAEATALQNALNAKGAALEVDGHFGELSKLALIRFQSEQGLPDTGNPDAETLTALGIPNLFYKPKPKGLFDMNSTWLTTFVASTAFKYLVAMIATYVASKLGLDPVEGKATIEGVLTQLVGVAMGVWGMWESSRNKIVLDGKKVAVSNLDAADKKAVKEIVASN